MDELELEKTKALDEEMKELKEVDDAYKEYNNMFRERKYSNIQEALDQEEKSQEIEILDMSMEEEDKETGEQMKEQKKPIPEKKQSVFTKLKNKWLDLPKKKKIIFIILFALILIIMITGIVLLVTHSKKEEEKPQEKVEDIVIIKDNYIYKNGNLEFLDADDNTIGTYSCENKDEKLCYVPYNLAALDTVKRELNVYEDETPLYERMNFYYNRYAFVYDNKSQEDGYVSLYDFKEDKKEGSFALVKAYVVNDRNYVITKEDKGNFVLYEITNTGLVKLIDEGYKSLSIIPDKETNYVVAELSSGYYLLDYNGKEVSKLISKTIFDYNEDYIVTVENGVYSLYDYNNKQQITGFKFITLDNEYVLLVDGSNRLFFRDNELSKMHEEGFQLNNENFLVKNVFDENGLRINSMYAFVASYTNDEITITLSNENQNGQIYKYINLKEVSYNKAIKYYSYLDGKLFFYEDEAKEKYIGSYTCTNKNDTIVEGELLSSCRPALDTIYEDNDMTYSTGGVSMAPIFNKRFVFIEDSTLNTKNVKLIDLSDESKVYPYESINTHTAANKGELSHVAVNGIDVIAKNTKGKYGMIHIDQKGITSVYAFNYESMEMLGDKVLALNGNNKWLLLGDTPSAEISGKIRGYFVANNKTYLKVKEGNDYYVYDYEGHKLVTDGYKYVELYADMYAGVSSDNKLMLYDYAKHPLLDEPVQLSSTTYYGNGSNAFMIATSGETIIIEVYKDGNYTSVRKKLLPVDQESPGNGTLVVQPTE